MWLFVVVTNKQQKETTGKERRILCIQTDCRRGMIGEDCHLYGDEYDNSMGRIEEEIPSLVS